MKRSRTSICEAVRRVQVEELLPVAVVAKHLGEPPPKVVRWIIRGTRGVHLDGVHNPIVGWQSSIAAAERFRAALAACDRAA